MIKKQIVPENNAKADGEESTDSFMTRAAKVLDCLSEGISTLSDIAKRCNVGASTAHRLLATLTKPGLVIYNPSSHRYYLGPRVAQLSANPVTSHQYLIMSCNNEMEHLSTVVEETITISLMVGIQYVPLHSVYSSHRLIVLEEFRGIRPVVPEGATDLILLSQLNEKELSQTLKIGRIWQGLQDFSVDENEAWLKRITKIREDGHAVTRGEKVSGGLGLAVPVKNYFCPVALTIIGPEYRLEPRLKDLINELTQSGSRLSDILAKLFPQT